MSLFLTYTNELDRTVKIFDEFYSSNLIVNSNDYDVVFSFFKSNCDTITIASNYTALFFRIAQEAGISAMELLDSIRTNTTDKLSINKVFCYYLNTFKSKSSLYGIAVVPKPVQPVARNVVL